MDRRLENLNELGRVLLKSFRGEAVRLVEAAGNSAPNLARLLAREMPSYRDTARYRGQKVFFYKRAQILAADLYGAFRGRDWGGFKDMEALTAFADYKLPQVLRHLGIMRYGDSLAGRVDSNELIAPGSEEEIEIRANTLMAVELIRRELERSGHDLRAFEIDWILWNLGQDEEFRKRPYHKTVTVYY
jgi:hypothetical protein